ncbi:MAG: helix-turn-helix transcriptional regulator [Clostridia bacterium]|nr:helix-turn-helix transcriptional regulator [Clostridia bacterium]
MRRSIFIRYALSYTLVLLVLFSGISAYLLYTSQRQIQERMVETQINRLTRIAMQHESAISAMISTAEEMGLSPQIEGFSYEKEPWKAYELQMQLVPYTAINTFCDQMYLTFRGEDRMYTSASSMTIDRFLRMTEFESTDPDTLRQQLQGQDRITVLPAQRIRSSLMDGTESRMVGFILPLGSNPGASKGSLFFLVKESSYRNLFADAIDTELNTYIFYGDQLLTQAEDLPLSAQEVNWTPKEGEYSRVLSSQGEKWLAVTLEDRSWGMRYMTALRMSTVNAAVWRSLSNVMIMLGALLTASVALILWIARRHARPIEEISSLLAPEAAERKDELTQISSGIRQLTARNSELASQLEQSLPMRRRYFVFRFIKRRFAEEGEIARAAAGLGLDIDKKYYGVILCSASEEWDRPFEINQEPFASLRGGSAVGAELVAMKAYLFLAFAEEPALIYDLAERIRRKDSGEGNNGVTALSALHTSYTEAPTAYLEAAAAYENRFVMGRERVVTYGDLSANLEDVLPRAQKITNGISQALALNNRERLDEQISELLRFLKNTSMSPFAFRMIYNDVIDTLTRSQAAKLADGREARDFYDIFTLTSCQTIDDLDELLRRLCDQLMREEAEPQGQTPPAEDPISQAARYIDAHFTDPEISMAAIAESFDLSTAKLSLSFKERMGLTPSDYLTLLRSEKAKELLRETELTIREISVQVGYYDSGSFIRRFKQVVGETPLQYRKETADSSRGEGSTAT